MSLVARLEKGEIVMSRGSERQRMKETERGKKKVEGVEGVERVKVKPKSPREERKGFHLSNRN
jgi:hypothetical protein